jgi:Tol biopolymer transport system component
MAPNGICGRGFERGSGGGLAYADVPSKPRAGDEEFNFSPDGLRVAFTARIKGKSEAWSTNFDVFETAADGHSEPRNLTGGNLAWDTEPTYSGDGRWLAWKAMDKTVRSGTAK